MNQKFNEIMKLYGAEEFKRIIKKWDVLSENMDTIAGRPKIVLPDLLWIMNSGVGRTNLLGHLAEYLYSKGNLMDFSGNVKFFEFMLNSNNISSNYNEIQRFMDVVRVAAGFRNEYRGIVCVDVNEWVYNYKDKLFISFLELLSSHSEDWLIVLSINEENGTSCEKFILFVSTYLRIETLKLETPSVDDLFVYVKNKLSSHGLSLNKQSGEQIKLSVEKLKNSDNFDGFKTLDMLAQDIVYEHFCVPNSHKGVIPKSVVKRFSAESEYITRLACRQKHTIGFNGGF